MTDTKPPPNARPTSSLNFPVVGIGASAGGLMAARKVLKAVPSNSGMLLRPEAPREPAGPRLSDLHLLVVEDSIDAAGTLRLLLELEGARVNVAHDGAAALAAVQAERPDLVISDIGMPGLNGYDFVSTLRATPETADLPAVAFTGFGPQQDIDHALRVGFDAHVAKPVLIDDLAAQLLAVLRR